jgi:ribosome-binding protein aMBF1 (putative translation factor)
MKTTSNAVEILDHMIGENSEMQTMLEEEREKSRIARMVYEARTNAGLTQSELALRVRVRPSSIARLEDADYEGDALTLLARIARSLDQRVEVRLVPRQPETAAS